MDKDQFLRLVENLEALKTAAQDQNTAFCVELNRLRRATISNFTGRCLVDLREFYEPKTGGELKPSKKGISFDPALLDVLVVHKDAIIQSLN